MPEFDDTFDNPVKIGAPFHGTVERDALKLNVPDQPTDPIVGESLNAGTLETVKLSRNPDTSQPHTLSNAAPLHQANTAYSAGDYIKDAYGWVYRNIGSSGISAPTPPDFASSNYGDEEPDGPNIIWKNLGEFVPVHTGNYLLTIHGVYFGDSSTDNGMPEGCPLTIDYTPLAGTYLEYPIHFDGGVHVIKSPAAHAVETTGDEAAEGMEWRTYALLTARENIVAGNELGAGRWLYIDGNNNPWIVGVNLSKDDVANSVTIELVLVRLFGRMDAADGTTFGEINRVLHSVTYTGASELQTRFYTDSSVNVHIGASISMGISPNYTGSACYLNVYSVRDDPITYPPADGTTPVNFGCYLGSVGGVDEPVPSNEAVYPARLLAYFAISVSGDGNIVPDEAGNYGDGIAGSISWVASRETFDNDPSFDHYPNDPNDAFLKIKRVYANGASAWLETRLQNYVIHNPDPYPTANINGAYDNLIYSANGVEITVAPADVAYMPSLKNPTMLRRIQGPSGAETGIEVMYMDGSNTVLPYSTTLGYAYQPETGEWFSADNNRYVNFA